MLFDRIIFHQIVDSAQQSDRVTILYGPRQVGKTTLFNTLLPLLPHPQTILNGDDSRTLSQITPRLDILSSTVGQSRLLAIDEAQRIENVGLSLKIVHDQLKIPILVTGSSSFDLSSRINEPLTGRTRTFTLYPLSLPEIPADPLDPDKKDLLLTLLRFGSYPKTVSLPGDKEKQEYLEELVNSYLYRDLLELNLIRKPKKSLDLLSALALQTGSQVSIQELCQTTSLDRSSVERYLDILEKMFIIYNLRGFSRNLRKEISKTSKYYFLDLGIRNALIRNFNPLNLRSDTGQLFENFCFLERLKYTSNTGRLPNFYFWRTWDQKEIDLIEEYAGHLTAWEFKFSPSGTSSAFREFSHTYSNSSLQTISIDHIKRLSHNQNTKFDLVIDNPVSKY